MRLLQSRYQSEKESWIRPENLTWEKGYLGNENPPNWDVKSDGSEIVHCVAPLTFYFYKVTQLSQNEIEKLKEEKIKQDAEKVQRSKVLSVVSSATLAPNVFGLGEGGDFHDKC